MANDEQGAFGDLVVIKKTYGDQKTQFLKQAPNLKLFDQTLIKLRKSVRLLTRRSLEERTWFVTQLFENLKAKVKNPNNSTEEPIGSDKVSITIWLPLGERAYDRFSTPDIKYIDSITIWALLALLRACDKFWTPDIKEWFEGEVVSLQRLWPEEDAWTLLGTKDRLEERYAFFFDGRRTELYIPLVAELCERDQLLSDKQSPLKCNVTSFSEYYAKTAENYYNVGNWSSAAEYYTAAIEKEPNLPGGVYLEAAQTHFYLENWVLASKYYAIAFEKDRELRTYNCLNAGYAAARTNQPEKAAYYFEELITGRDASKNFRITFLYNQFDLCTDTLDIIERTLTVSNSKIRFRDWLRFVKNRDFEALASFKAENE